MTTLSVLLPKDHMDRGAWQASATGLQRSRTRLSRKQQQHRYCSWIRISYIPHKKAGDPEMTLLLYVLCASSCFIVGSGIKADSTGFELLAVMNKLYIPLQPYSLSTFYLLFIFYQQTVLAISYPSGRSISTFFLL